MEPLVCAAAACPSSAAAKLSLVRHPCTRAEPRPAGRAAPRRLSYAEARCPVPRAIPMLRAIDCAVSARRATRAKRGSCKRSSSGHLLGGEGAKDRRSAAPADAALREQARTQAQTGRRRQSRSLAASGQSEGNSGTQKRCSATAGPPSKSVGAACRQQDSGQRRRRRRQGGGAVVPSDTRRAFSSNAPCRCRDGGWRREQREATRPALPTPHCSSRRARTELASSAAAAGRRPPLAALLGVARGIWTGQTAARRRSGRCQAPPHRMPSPGV